MVHHRQVNHRTAQGEIVLTTWLERIKTKYTKNDCSLIKQACELSEISTNDSPQLLNDQYSQQSLNIADFLVELKLDAECIASAIVYPRRQYADLTEEDITAHLGPNVAALVAGIERMDAIQILHQHNPNLSGTKIENLRKMLLAMVDDVRVVLIKLAERLLIMRQLKNQSSSHQVTTARETHDLYAPLANRLGLGQIKWELEDQAFRFLNPEQYHSIAKQLSGKRADRESYIQDAIDLMQNRLQQEGMQGVEIQGRAKHIYSIYRKMQRKQVDFSSIYDTLAIRVLVESIDDCYRALSIVHELWQQIPEEYDDYISNPKPNGYRSLHTAVNLPGNNNLEVQIRTYPMHEESELGIAAHWQYKEGATRRDNYADKIAWLRQVLDWQRELHTEQKQTEADDQVSQYFDDRVYIFAPQSEILDLPKGATPLDFAYHIHSEVGHRCRGAKVNGSIVPLTYLLKTGDQVEILTGNQASPSRDWLNPQLGFLKSSRSRAKIHHWFKQQDHDKNFEHGSQLLERELKRLKLAMPDLESIAKKFNFKRSRDLIASLGAGDIKLQQLINLTKQTNDNHPTEESLIKLRASTNTSKTDIEILGVSDLMNHIALCCKPLPGDPIVGYITQGRGIAIHHQDCSNIQHTPEHYQTRIVDVDWGTNQDHAYQVDLHIIAAHSPDVIRDISTLLSNEKVNINNFSSQSLSGQIQIMLTLEVNHKATLDRLLERIKQLPNILEIRRINQS